MYELATGYKSFSVAFSPDDAYFYALMERDWMYKIDALSGEILEEIPTISYKLQQPVIVQISIFNHLGKQVEFIQQKQSSGKQEITWDASGLPPGIYYFRMQAGEQVASGKMVLVR